MSDAHQTGRLSVVESYRGDLELRGQFKAIQLAVEIADRTEHPVLVVGDYVVEEMASYLVSIRGYAYHHFIAVGARGYRLVDYISHRYRGRTKVLRRIESFLSSYMATAQIDMHEILASGSSSVDYKTVRNFIASHYVKTRKVPEGALNEINDFLDYVETIEIDGPIIVSEYYRGWNAEQALAVSLWNNLRVKFPLVFVVRDDGDTSETTNVVKRQPATIGEVFDVISTSLSKSRSVVAKMFPLWRASQGTRANVGKTEDSIISLGSAGSFATFVRNADNIDLADGEIHIPAKIVAPVMFKEIENAIDLDHTQISGVPVSQAVGAARALANQSEELASSGVLDNALPRSGNLLKRLTVVLRRIASSSKIEEADIVEFGVEFSNFETRVYEAKDRLGSLSKDEVLGFVGEGTRFLFRFEAWRAYREQGENNTGLADERTAALAAEILYLAVRDEVFTTTAAARVKANLDGFELDQRETREGISRSTENLSAALGRSALKSVKASAKELGNEAKERVVTEIGDVSESFIRRHSAKLIKFAGSRSGRWLQMLLEHLDSL